MSTTQLAVVLFLIVAILVILVVLFFGWAVRSGQFKDVEGIKYRMLEDDAEEHEAHERLEGQEGKSVRDGPG